ncbi:TPA: DUF905 domain-containing protein [Escherichia coli]|nr:DUF905 domain-containing protein [Escherichia coli]EFA3982826.1 DUF905 domain-containing protein [Escherichia coli]EFH2823110.1 DUF905 domain-containing protein [Escherichia coli]EFH2973152.1 DUF905 domain-containing protein [Escherichia coli]EFH5757843.1 DUF905 domain-containing protein [Escherichia coli]
MPGYTEYVLAEGSFSYGQAVAVITAYRNVFIQDDPGMHFRWVSRNAKVSDAGAAGILNPMPERCLIRGSPVTVFSDNKRHSFHPSGRVFSGRRGFFIYYTSKS